MSWLSIAYRWIRDKLRDESGRPPVIDAWQPSPEPRGFVAKRAHDFWVAKGFTENQVAGILANIEAESAFDPDVMGDGGTSGGLYQFHAARLAALRSKYGPTPSDMEQHEYAHWEITEGLEQNVGVLLRQATTAYLAARVWCRYFERPADIDSEAFSRGLAAQKFVGLYEHRDI